jgi:hypothetical protein
MGRMRVGMLAAASVLALTGCSSGHRVASRSKQAHQPVVYATAVTSPDGKRIAVVTHNRTAIEVGPASGGHRRTIYRSAPAGITTDFYWASPYLIVFGDTDFEVSTIDVRTRRLLQIANADSFGVSSDGRWVAWWQSGGITGPGTVGIVSVKGDVPVPAEARDQGGLVCVLQARREATLLHARAVRQRNGRVRGFRPAHERADLEPVLQAFLGFSP